MIFSAEQEEHETVLLDIGGEGRHPEAWNLNPSDLKTIGKDRGAPIPRHIPGRADCIPFPGRSVERIIVERTPLRITALYEIARVVTLNGTIILRHARLPCGDPHAPAKRIFSGRWTQCMTHLGRQIVQETEFRLSGRTSSRTEEPKHDNFDCS